MNRISEFLRNLNCKLNILSSELNKIFNKILENSNKVKIISIILSIIILGILLQKNYYYRWIGYERIPSTTVTDEFDYVWQGLSVRETGLPVAWSTLGGVYKNPKYNPLSGNLSGFGIKVDGTLIDIKKFKENNSRPLVAVEQIDYNKGLEYMFFTAPFFDHSPLGGLIYSLGINKNVKNFEDVESAEFRKPALVLGVISSFLIFVLTLLLTGNPWIGIASFLIYSTVPTYIFGTRAAYLENVASPLILLFIILLIFSDVYKTKLEKWQNLCLYFVGGLVGGLGIVTKEPAVGFAIGALAVLLLRKIQWKYISASIVGLSIPIIGYFSWGMWLQKDLFIAIFFANSSREFFGSLKFISMMEALRFENFPIDGWWIWGFISLLIVSFSIDRKSRLLYLIVPLFAHIATVLLIGSPNYPWYYLTTIPFLAICSGLVIWRIIIKPTIPLILAFFVIPFSSSFYWGYSVFHQLNNLNVYRLIFICMLLLAILNTFAENNKLFRGLWFVFIGIVLYEIYKWNQRSIQFIVTNWGNLPIPSLPNY